MVERVPYPEIVPPIYIPLDHIPISLWEIRLEAVLLTNPSALLVACLLVLLIVAMGGVKLAQGSARPFH